MEYKYRSSILKKGCDFHYDKTDKEIIYKDYFKYEFTKQGILIKVLDYRKDDFDWEKEIAELCVELKRIMLGTIHGFAKVNPARYSQLQEKENIRSLYEQIKKIHSFNGSKDSGEKAWFRLFLKLVEYRDTSADTIRLSAKKREFEVAQAIKKIRKMDIQNINIYYPKLKKVHGCAGHANLISDELIHVTKNIVVNLFEIFEPGQASARKNIFSYEKNKSSRINYFGISDIVEGDDNGRLIRKIKSARMHILISHYCFPRVIPKLFKMVSRGSSFLVADSVFTNAYKKTHDIEENLSEPSAVSNDLHNPFGTMILNGELLKKKQKKDNYSKECIQRKRRLWLISALGREKFNGLVKLAKNNKWDPVKAVWSFAYCVKNDLFVEELHMLLSALSPPLSDVIPFVHGGKQIIIHFIRHGEVDRSLCDETLKKMGITVIDENGKIMNGDNSKLPITIIIHDYLPNNKIEALMTELNGTLARNRTNKFWIDFPLFITGTSSWGEAISSGSVYLHDGYDGGTNNRSIMIETLIKIFAIRDAHRCFSYADLRDAAEKQLGKLLMGEDKNKEKYYKLEEWTGSSRDNAKILMKFNLVDDILIKLGHKGPVRNPPLSNAETYLGPEF